MTPSIDLVREFHHTFGHPLPDKITLDNNQSNHLRFSLLAEELDELGKALLQRDPVATLDALTDLQYVLDGAYLAFGLGHFKDAAVREVHRSNMSKLGPDGKPMYRPDGKVMKGPNYTAPNLKPILEGAHEH